MLKCRLKSAVVVFHLGVFQDPAIFTQAGTPAYFARRVLATCRWQYGQLRFRLNLQYNIVARQVEKTCCLMAELYKLGNRTVRAEKATPLGSAGV